MPRVLQGRGAQAPAAAADVLEMPAAQDRITIGQGAPQAGAATTTAELRADADQQGTAVLHAAPPPR